MKLRINPNHHTKYELVSLIVREVCGDRFCSACGLPCEDLFPRVRTTLYRMFSEDQKLLYVGITSHPGYRLEQHQSEKSWWGDVADIHLVHYPTREMARVAEILAIRTENPLRNIADRGWPVTHDRARNEIPGTVDPNVLIADWFDANHLLEEILVAHGWWMLWENESQSGWGHPEWPKTATQPSAVIRDQRLLVLSVDTPFQAARPESNPRTYSAFEVWTVLANDGRPDQASRAAKRLWEASCITENHEEVPT